MAKLFPMAKESRRRGPNFRIKECSFKIDDEYFFRLFEAKIQSYAGDDPLDLWVRFVQWAEPRLLPAEKDVLISLMEKIVNNFRNDKKYSNDQRYIHCWLKLINNSTTPLEFFNHMYEQEIGTKLALFYLAWAEVLEKKGKVSIADRVFQKGIQNAAQPQSMLLHQYGSFTARVSHYVSTAKIENSVGSAPASLANEQSMHSKIPDDPQHEPLGNSQLINRDSSDLSKLNLNVVPEGLKTFSKSQHLDLLATQGNEQNDCSGKQSTLATCGSEARTLSTPKNSIAPESVQQTNCKMLAAHHEVQQVVMYHKGALFFGDKEMCFEEIRAQKYMAQKQQKEQEEWKEILRSTKCEEIRLLEQKLEELRMQLKLIQGEEQEMLQTSSQDALQPATATLPTRSGTHDLATALPGEANRREENEQNSSLGTCDGTVMAASLTGAVFQQSQRGASLLLPKKDNKQRCPGVQPGFQYIREPEYSLNNSRAQLEPPSRSVVTNGKQLMNDSVNNSGAISFTRPKEGKFKLWNVSGLTMNRSHTPNSSFGLIQATPSKVLPSPTVCTKEALDLIMDMFQAPVIPELSQVDDKRRAFAEDQMEVQDSNFCKKDDVHQSMNIAPPSTAPFCIFEDCDGVVNRIQNTLNNKPTDSRPLEELSEKQIATRKVEELHDKAVWSVCDNKTLTINLNVTDVPFAAQLASTPFHVIPQHPKQDSEECNEKSAQIKNDELVVCSSSEEEYIQLAKVRKLGSFQDLGSEPINHLSAPAFDSSINQDVSSQKPILEEFQMVEERQECPQLIPEEECLKPEQSFCCLNEMYCSGLQFDEEPKETLPETAVIVKNPWDKDLIHELLSNLPKPLSSYSSFMTWQVNMPAVRPKANLHLGNEMYLISYLLGEGSFAHVYQASVLDMNNLSDVKNQQKVSLKVQKISNPWEFYINTQLTERLKPMFCSLYNSIHSGHFFKNGCILVGELYNFGTLLNAANLYKTLIEKVMPQPLVIYFAIHILYIVEQLHCIGIIHGDIKPDNFILGERFLDSDAASVDDSVSQGLTLIDFGQSIDMKLFPPNAVFVESCKTSGFQCIEMLSGKPWTFQTDYFGIAATVYCLLFGSYLKLKEENGIWKVNATFKRGHHVDVWNRFFNTLLYIPNCQSLPSLRDLREELVLLFKEQYSKKLKSLRQRLMVLLLEKKHSQRRA
ncbi:mitotic checkpoint serine/threonine-protein kinase BUB1 [Narcine bancroftii]|uniref:mitotic checkpoint serine/threonine-protein kinase BUB1 n=1 Tax=Narcine bancroftii TaxID=1343680 RepID=UPI0038321A60